MNKFLGNIRLAIKAIYGKKIRSFLTMLGIIIGVFSIVLLIGIGQGVKDEVTGQIEGFGSNILTIMPGSIGGGPAGRSGGSMTLEDLDTINSVDGLDFTVPISMVPLPVSITEPVAPSELTPEQVQMMQAQEEDASGFMSGANDVVLAIGTNRQVDEILVTTDVISAGDIVGRLFSDEEYNNASHVATIMPGAMGTLFPDFSAEEVIGKTIYVGKEEFEIIGASDPKESESILDDQAMTNVIAIPLTAIADLTGEINISQFMTSVTDAEEVDIVKEKIRNALLETRDGVEDFSIITQEEILSMLDQILSLMTTMLSGIAAISLLVGGIGVMNIMLVSVTERTFEIGLRKAIGASNSDILIQFLVEAILLTFLGGTIGIACAYLGAFIMDAQLGLAPAINMQSLLLAYSFTAVIGIVFGVAPAIRASRLDPITALRHE